MENGKVLFHENEMPDLGLSEEAARGVVKILCTLLADEHVLYIKLRKYHWNVQGPQFFSLHELFEEQYTTLATQIDEIAERIVQYGAEAPGSMEAFIPMARLEEDNDKSPDAHGMVANIKRDHEKLVRALREDIEAAAEEYEDSGAEDFLTALLQLHQELAWMTRAFLKGMPIAQPS
jgi:starvation-inducible DNA-binding protein